MITEIRTPEQFNSLDIADKKNICFDWYKQFKNSSIVSSQDNANVSRRIWEECVKRTDTTSVQVYIPTASKIVDIFSEQGKQNGWSVFIHEAEAKVFNHTVTARTRKTQVTYDTLAPKQKEKVDKSLKKYYTIVRVWFDLCKEKVGDVPTYKQWNEVCHEFNKSEKTYPMHRMTEKMPNAGQVTQLFYRWSIFIELFNESKVEKEIRRISEQVEDLLSPIKSSLSEVKKEMPISVVNLLKNPEDLDYLIERLRSHSIILDIRTAFFNNARKRNIAEAFKKSLVSVDIHALEDNFETAEQLYSSQSGDLVIRAKLRAILKNITFIISLNDAFSIIES